jgi:UDP-GlcNAc:undecaprenyl-phosphate GlcNAc-1-phosphate transferase
MNALILTSLVTLAASLMLTVAVRRLARHWGVVDRPDGRRKLHGRPTPLWGGVAVYGATVIGLLALRLSPIVAGHAFLELSTVWMLAAGFVCLVGGIDDLFDLPSRVKLVLQVVSVLPIVLFGHYVDRVVAFGYPIELGWLAIPLTVLWLVGCINALNLLDGMDGLASIVGLSTAAMMGLVAANEGHPHVAVMATVLAAALLGFLVYNLPPASVFLGDSGSMVIGLSVGLLGIEGTLKTSATLAITAPAVAMTLPILDILAAVVRRKLTGKRLDAADRLHIHHRLLDRGWTPWQILCLTGAICLTTGCAATAATIFRRDALAWITAMTLIVLMVRFRLFGYEEFSLVKHAAVRVVQSFLSTVRSMVGWSKGLERGPAMRVEDDDLPRIAAPEGKMSNAPLWDLLLRDVRRWDVRQIEFSVSQDRQFRRIRWMDPAMRVNEECCWSLSVSLPDPTGRICELRASSVRPITEEADLVALTTLLKTAGTQFALHSEEIFGPALIVSPPTAATLPEGQRKAA